MVNSPPRLQDSESAMKLSGLQRYADGWIMAGEIARHSERTIGNRRMVLKNLFWFLRREDYESCGLLELRSFFVYINRGHKDPGGRWGNPQQTTPVKARTVKDYHSTLRTLFGWIVAEGGLESSPMKRIPVPVDRADDIQPFSEEQVLQLRAAAKKSRQAGRDEAIVAFLVDTGVRASELCALRFSDFDITAKRATVEGKGGKTRPVYFGRITARALWQYLRDEGREIDEPLFQSERGDALTRSGLQQLVERLAIAAKIAGVRASPHTFRHTFAISFLRSGGNQFSLMSLLGHTNLQMTARYVKLAQADVENQHRAHSPADMIMGGKKR
jgi:site-specific recombinase XerD